MRFPCCCFRFDRFPPHAGRRPCRNPTPFPARRWFVGSGDLRRWVLNKKTCNYYNEGRGDSKGAAGIQPVLKRRAVCSAGDSPFRPLLCPFRATGPKGTVPFGPCYVQPVRKWPASSYLDAYMISGFLLFIQSSLFSF